jgi:radical SAM superfamily enzyme YgiQ (UPF0313 family)
MNVLLVNPEFPDSFWSMKHSLRFSRARWAFPPLGLVTVAALLPQHWTFRLVDLNVETLRDDDLRWADVVMLTGMLVQRPSLHRTLARCREIGVRTVVGGPYATALPHDLADAGVVVVGELEEIASALAADLEAGRPHPVYREAGKPDLARSPLPRFDLLDPSAYYLMSLQFSRGCPFTCEFCDIIVLYGRRPRTKSAAQVIAELDAIAETGFVGPILFVDDNFIGNQKAVKAILPELGRWRRRQGPHFSFFTEASINLADDPELLELMTGAGFAGVFVGIETPSPEALRETRKLQNLRGDLVAQVHELQDHSLDVAGGFILGFDHDGPDIFDRMIRFVRESSIPTAMVGLLVALPNTPLYHRLERDRRLRPEIPGDQFGLTNVVTVLPAETLVAGYARVLRALFDPEPYFERARDNLRRLRPSAPRPLAWRDLEAGARAIWAQGIVGRYRRDYWRFLGWTFRHHPRLLARALEMAAVGHHQITYAREVVIPRLDAEAEALRGEGRAGAQPRLGADAGIAVGIAS